MSAPPGVKPADFAAALAQFAHALGAQWVYTRPEDVELYRDAYSVERDEPSERLTSAALAPDTVEQVQAIVGIANQYRIPLYPISTGRNLGYGGSAPTLSGNEPLHYCIVEPGVSFYDLDAHLRSRNIRLYPSLPNPGWGSPIGNALDHGFGLPGRDHFKNHCGMEVVLPNGEVLRTGMGALPGAPTWATYPYGFGPQIDGLFSQSNFGIVTKMGFNLFREPEAIRRLQISSARFDDLEALVAAAEYLENVGLCPGGIDIMSPLLASETDPEVVARIKRGAAASDWDQLARDRKQAIYVATLSARGIASVCEAQMAAAREKLLAAVPGVKVVPGPAWDGPLDVAKVPEFERQSFGLPSLSGFSFMGPPEQDWHGHIFFSPVLPQTGEAVQRANRVFQQALDSVGLYWGWQGGFCMFPKNLSVLKALPSGRDAAEDRRTRAGVERLVDAAAANGWSEYRSGPAFYQAIARKFSFNNGALPRFHEILKDAIDPHGILAAGRYDIWPRHLRKGRT
jgi:4-cresol dehydrogenase (hydroxylating)